MHVFCISFFFWLLHFVPPPQNSPRSILFYLSPSPPNKQPSSSTKTMLSSVHTVTFWPFLVLWILYSIPTAWLLQLLGLINSPSIEISLQAVGVSTKDNSSKVVLVTGSNTGIGKEVPRLFARMGFTVVLGVRSLERGEAAAKEIRQHIGGKIGSFSCNFESSVGVAEIASPSRCRHWVVVCQW